MAWWIAFGVVFLAGFYDSEVARYLPVNGLAMRHMSIGGCIGLAMGFTIHAFRRI